MGTFGKYDLSRWRHLQQLSMYIPDSFTPLFLNSNERASKRGFTSSKLSDIANDHLINCPFSFIIQKSDVYCVIQAPSSFLSKPIFAAALKVWSQLIHLAFNELIASVKRCCFSLNDAM